MKRKAMAAMALTVCLLAMPVQVEGLLNGSKDTIGNPAASGASGGADVSSAAETKSVGRYGEKYAMIGTLAVVLPPEGSEIPQPAVTKDKSGKYSVSYAIDRGKQYSANDQAVIAIIDSWNTAGGKSTIEVQTASGTKAVTGTFDTGAAKKVFMLVNEKRAEANLSALSWDASLASAARLRAAEITVNNSHTRPDGSNCFTTVQGMTGENIADGYQTPEIAMREWMSSSGHKTNILRSTFDKMGVAAFTSGGHIYWVQDFGGY